jgi:hypothetical protein
MYWKRLKGNTNVKNIAIQARDNKGFNKASGSGVGKESGSET